MRSAVSSQPRIWRDSAGRTHSPGGAGAEGAAFSPTSHHARAADVVRPGGGVGRAEGRSVGVGEGALGAVGAVEEDKLDAALQVLAHGTGPRAERLGVLREAVQAEDLQLILGGGGAIFSARERGRALTEGSRPDLHLHPPPSERRDERKFRGAPSAERHVA